MNEETWKKIGRIKDFDSVRSGFLGYCQICKETLHNGKEIIIKKDKLRTWIRTHTGKCTDKFIKILKKSSK